MAKSPKLTQSLKGLTDMGKSIDEASKSLEIDASLAWAIGHYRVSIISLFLCKYFQKFVGYPPLWPNSAIMVIAIRRTYY